MKTVLFVDDEPNVLNGLRRTLHAMEKEWEMVFCDNPLQAIEWITQGRHFDVVISDMQMPAMHGSEFLGRVMALDPLTVRLALSGHTDANNLMRSNVVAHQFLSKPADPRKLVSLVKRACVLRDRLSSATLSQKLLMVGGVPSVPRVYEHILEEIQSSDPSVPRVAPWIEKDVGLTSKVLQLVNSAFMGLKNHVSDIRQACTLLGLEHLRVLVLMAEIFSMAQDTPLRRYLNLDALWARSMQIAEYAGKIATELTSERIQISDAYTAGLLHEIGQIILAQRLPDEFGKAFEYAETHKVSLFDAEKELFGSTHATISGYLLELWGLPDPIVEAVTYYDFPSGLPEASYDLGEDESGIALVALHVAAYLASSETSPMKTTMPVEIDSSYLESRGLMKHMERWYDLCLS